jgi:hypothetical protein
MTQGTTQGLIRNEDFIAVTDATPQAGAMIFWELSGMVDAQALRKAWAAAGLDAALVPDDPAPKTALKRAVDTLAEKRKLVRPVQNGYSLVEESETGEKLDYKQQVTATLDSVGILKVDPAEGTLADLIRASYQSHLEQLVPSDISGLLVDLCDSLLAVALRARGGFYFLPPDSVGKFQAAVCVLRSVSSHLCYEIPALKTESAVQAILAAVEREASAEIEEFEAILTNTEAGPRALKTKVRQCSGVAEKVAAYEKLLGLSLVELQDRLSGLRSRLTEASLMASEAEAAA